MGWIMLLFLVGTIAFIVLYLKAFYAESDHRQEKAKENIERNGGQRVLEWSMPTDDGPPDSEFGELIAEIPAKMGEAAKFYKLGFTVGKKRIPYNNIKDILVVDATTGGSITQNSAKIWIYQIKGSTIGINGLFYNIDIDIAHDIKQGLGF